MRKLHKNFVKENEKIIQTITCECPPLSFKLKVTNMSRFNIPREHVTGSRKLCCLERVLWTNLKENAQSVKT